MTRKKSEKSQRPTGRGRRLLRLLLKIAGFGVAALVLIVIIGYVVVRLMFPPETIKRMAADQVRKYTGRELNITTVNLNPVNGFELRGLVLEALADSAAKDTSIIPLPLDRVSIEKIRLKYYLRPLLQKRFLVREIAIEAPMVALSIIAPDSTREKLPEEPAQPIVIPVQIELERFSIANATVTLNMRDSSGQIFASIDHLNLSVENLFLPRGDILQPGAALHAEARFRCADSRLSLTTEMTSPVNRLELGSDLNLDLAVTIQKLDSLGLSAELALANLALQSSTPDTQMSIRITEPIALGLTSQADYFAQSVILENLDLEVAGQKWLSLSGSARNFIQKPEFDVIVDRGEIPIRQVMDLVTLTMPQLAATLPVIQQERPILAITGTQVQGKIGPNPEDLDLTFRARLESTPISARLADLDGAIEDLALHFRLEGRFKPPMDTESDLGLNLEFASARFALDDTTQWTSSGGELGLTARLDSNFLPRTANLSVLVSLLEQTVLDGKFSLKSRNNPFNLSGEGVLNLSRLPIAALPATPMRGWINAQIEVGLTSLADVRSTVKIGATQLELFQTGRYESIPDLNFLALISARTDSTFQMVYVDSIRASVNQVLDLQASALFNSHNQDFGFNLGHLTLRHQQALALLPASIQSAMSGMAVSGFTQATGSGTGRLLADRLKYDAKIAVTTQATHVDSLPEQMKVHGINADLRLDASETGARADFVMVVDSIMLPLVRSQALTGNKVVFQVQSADFIDAFLQDGLMTVPDLGVKATISANARNLTTAPVFQAEVVLAQTAKEALSLTREVSMQGAIQARARILFDSLLTVSLDLRPEQVSVFLPQQMTIANVSGAVAYSLHFNPVTGTFINRNPQTTQLPGFNNVSYLSFNSYFNRPAQPLSEIKIEQVAMAGDYQLRNLNFSLFVENSRLEIPNFNMEFYGGNIGGYCFLELPEDINPGLARYQIAAHISSINSELLLKNAAEAKKEGVINGNFAFSGLGLDPEGDIDVSGYFYITEIGPKVATNLLRMLDPEDKDSGIKTTRRLLGHGFKPKLFSFELKHGFFYPTILFSRPFYFPIRLSEDKFELSRKPLKFFIDYARSASKKVGKT